MDPPSVPSFSQCLIFNSGSKPWMVVLDAGWSQLREKCEGIAFVCVHKIDLYVCLCALECVYV